MCDVSNDVFTTLDFVSLDEQGDYEFSFARKPGDNTLIRFEELDLSLVDKKQRCCIFAHLLLPINLLEPLSRD